MSQQQNKMNKSEFQVQSHNQVLAGGQIYLERRDAPLEVFQVERGDRCQH